MTSLPAEMTVIAIREPGGPEVLEVVDLPLPSPGPGQMLVRHQAVGLNYIDTYHRSGLYPVKTPLVIGLEAAGVVEAVGGSVTRFKIGDRVAYNGTMGAYAEAAVVRRGVARQHAFAAVEMAVQPVEDGQQAAHGLVVERRAGSALRRQCDGTTAMLHG